MKIYNIASICMLGLAIFGIASCSDEAEEVTQMNFNKNFAPLNADTKTTQETSATITWKASANATGYNVEVFADDSLTFSGTPVQTLSTTQTELTIVNLLFDTRYSVRIQAITEGNESRSSSWSYITFKTNAKQFLKAPKENDISDRSVTLTWNVEEGYDLTTVVVGDITHEVTAEEKAAQTATITGLTPETQYTAYLYYNGKECGKRTFTTIADLEGAIIVHDTDNLKNLVEAASDGDVFALYGGTYLLNANTPTDEETGEELPTTTGAIKVNKSITIKGIYPTSRPVLKGRFEIYDGASLEINQVVIDGSMNSTTDQVFNFKTADVNYKSLIVQNTEIGNFNNGKGLMYLNVKSTVENITFNNCVIHDITTNGGDFIDSRLGLPRSINLTNSTFYNVAASRDFIRIDDKTSDFPDQAGPVVTIDHCTLYNVGNGNANYRLTSIRFEGAAGNKLTFTNNIVVGTNYKRGFTNYATTDQNPTLSNNYYHNCKNLMSADDTADAAIKWFDENGTNADPGFKDPDNGDFTLNPDSDPAKGNAGDPRWK